MSRLDPASNKRTLPASNLPPTKWPKLRESIQPSDCTLQSISYSDDPQCWVTRTSEEVEAKLSYELKSCSSTHLGWSVENAEFAGGSLQHESISLHHASGNTIQDDYHFQQTALFRAGAQVLTDCPGPNPCLASSSRPILSTYPENQDAPFEEIGTRPEIVCYGMVSLRSSWLQKKAH